MWESKENVMKDYTKVRFKGEFRHYQQNILDNVKTHLKNKKIHIVAAPGSGKTTLGIELIRQLDKPALVLSPSLTIRNQWGDRFEHGFLDDQETIDDYVSYSLKDPKLMISITYQGLHAAYYRLLDDEENEDELIEKKTVHDYSDYDLIKTMRFHQITTICLDEAHHLRSEWHKALVEFINKCGTDITIISLTATPPYDSTPNQWEKYINLCGTIDEEIFVPELIARNNLCPHQDYIYFNYPSSEEKQDLKDYKSKAMKTTKEIIESSHFTTITNDFLHHYLDPRYNIFEDIEHYITLVNIAKSQKHKIPSKLKQIIKQRKFLNKYHTAQVEELFKYIINNPERFGVEHAAYIKKMLTDTKLIEKGRVNLDDNAMLKKALVSSIGKLRSIAAISQFESTNMGSELRMLILTDYIRGNQITMIGTDESNTTMGAVPIFEEVRRTVSPNVHIVILTGSLVIVHENILPHLDLEAKNQHTAYSAKKIDHVPYRIINFKSSNRDKVHIMTRLFEAGHIQIMIGTKALLGEGWDSPSINTLILASFVGSFMLSNQMRGRAIRVDPNKPEKIASIWHLATIEPGFLDVEDVLKNKKKKRKIDEHTTIKSHDYDTLSRRFESFLGPIYSKKGIESGIKRIDIIKPPYGEKEFKEINEQMFMYAKDRESVKEKWNAIVTKSSKHEILEVSEVPPKVWPLEIFIVDFLRFLFGTFLFGLLAYFLFPLLLKTTFGTYIALFLGLLYLIFLVRELPKVLSNRNPKKSVHSLGSVLLNTLKDLDKIMSPKATVVTKRNVITRKIDCSIAKATRRDKMVFSAAINELMTQIDNPRYVIIKKRKLFKKTYYNYWASYSVPKDIAAKKDDVELFAKKLSFLKGRYAVVYTRSVEGREELLKCKRKSRLSRHLIRIKSNRVVKT